MEIKIYMENLAPLNNALERFLQYKYINSINWNDDLSNPIRFDADSIFKSERKYFELFQKKYNIIGKFKESNDNFIIQKISWRKLILFANEIYNEMYIDQRQEYGFDKQIRIIAEILLKRHSELEKDRIIFSNEDFFINNNANRYRVIDCALKLEKEGIIKVHNIDISLNEGGFETLHGLTNEYLIIDLEIKDINKLKELSLVKKDNQILVDKKQFWFDDKTFKLKIADGTTKAINLSTTKVQGSDPFYLMLGLVELLKKKGIRKGIWLSSEITQKDIKTEIENYIKSKTIDNNWLKNTKANLLKNIPLDCKEYIEFSNYDRTQQCYLFGLKMPE